MGALFREPGGIKEGSGDVHLYPWGPSWETWERAHMLGAYVWKKVLRQISLHIGALLGDLGRGVCLPGTLRISSRWVLAMEHLSLYVSSVKWLQWSRESMLPLSTQVHGFKPGKSRRDFSGRKNPQCSFLRRGSKVVSTMSQICGM
jgi:hypothetical protein